MIPYNTPTNDELVSMIDFHVEMLTGDLEECFNLNDFSKAVDRKETREVFDELVEMKRLLAEVFDDKPVSNHLLHRRLLEETADRNA